MPNQRKNHSTSFPACFRPSTAVDDTLNASPSPLPPQAPGKTNLTSCFYHTNLGLFSLTWSRAFLGHSLLLNLYPSSHFSAPSPHPFSVLHFHLLIKPLLFWKRCGNRKLSTAIIPDVHVFWDFSRAKFGSGPEPESGFFIAVVVDGEMVLLVGDSTKEAYARTKAQIQNPGKTQTLVSRREHLFSNKLYITKARFGGKRREISIECNVNEDAELCFSFDNERVLQIKRLKWKFRGSDRIEVDGVSIQVSWDVYNWLFDQGLNNDHAVFVFKFEDEGSEFVEQVVGTFKEENDVHFCRPNSPTVDRKRRSLMMAGISSTSSSISTSSASSGGNSSVMEWESVEESELSAPTGFSLLVYAWKK